MDLPAGSLAIAVAAVTDALAVRGVDEEWVTGATIDVLYWDDGVSYVDTALDMLPVSRPFERYT
jgi:hypothetical protein